MHLNALLPLLQETQPFRALRQHLQDGRSVHALGVLRAARPYVLAALAQEWRAPVIYITARIDRAYNVSEQLPVWLRDAALIDRFAEPTPFLYERAPWSEASIQGRLETLAGLAFPSEQPLLIVTSARAIMQRTLPVDVFRERTLTLRAGQRVAMDRLIGQWVQVGYEPATVVVKQGTYSRRGGILDIFPLASEQPVRIDFFDDEIDSLRLFDINTQRSGDKLDTLLIPPAREALPVFAPAAAERLSDWFASLPATANDPTSPQEDAEALASGTASSYLEHYLPYFYDQSASLLDYAPTEALIVVEDRDELRASVQDIMRRADEAQAEKRTSNVIAPDHPRPYLTWDDLEAVLNARQSVDFGAMVDDEQPDAEYALRGVLTPELRFGGQLKPLLAQIRGLRNQSDRVVAVTVQASRLHELWRESDASPATFVGAGAGAAYILPLQPQSVTFVDGALQEGWRLRGVGGDLHMFTDAEIFGWTRPEPRRRHVSKRKTAPPVQSSDLREGDYVVHMDYGVGRFAGMRRRTLEGIEREYLMVEYAGTDALYVPIHQTDRLTRYVGADDTPPTITRLGQAEWGRIKSKAQKAVEEEAQELLAIYAARASAPGHAYAVDTPWQHEMEAAFPFIETEDQLKAVRSVKQDMEKPHPMDRLICGDVGYGKTEVAIRAAFKAVMDGRQVAVLVPTTILAQQHYETFKRRMSSFPVVVEALSRFRTRAEQIITLAKLAAGDVDIIIGTHRLLQDDVQFKNLGLVVIDEEQRFGVKHKEYLKSLRTQVDVLTLTATPIPRTLYMGLTGVRDISMIQTPPEERLPVITHVSTFDDRLVRQAIMREMERGGQVFVVHNRVQSIDLLADKLARIVPEARIVVGHGQMDERRLESVMEAFGNGEYDILLATSIIESGLDIPNANTLIVDRADWFGMAQLYQLRGRVGRSAQQAYAYFFHPADNRLTDDARARLETLSEYTDLGSGYQIAMRDLELRGAGDILSTRQTGHVAAIGLHLYTQMLAQAVQQLKGGQADGVLPKLSESAIMIDLPIPAYLPTDYIPELELRLQLYRRIGGLQNERELLAMHDELQDRFGALPPAVEGMLYQIQVKLGAEAAGATAVLHRAGRIEIRLPYLVEANRDLLALWLGNDLRVTRTAVEILLERDRWQTRVLTILGKLAERFRAARGS
ncbi:MAG: transcription-repair coupling factor [Chloroflexota bacterium]|nr:transcription-repair coupling factor [Chloroflexota bacterium]